MSAAQTALLVVTSLLSLCNDVISEKKVELSDDQVRHALGMAMASHDAWRQVWNYSRGRRGQDGSRTSRRRRLQEMTYVYDTDETPVEDSSGPWSDWVMSSQCSRYNGII